MGSYEKSEGVHLYIDLDKPINHHGERDSLMLWGWVNSKEFHWGHATVIEEK